MKQFYSGMLITLALVLAIVMGLVAMAESAEPETALPPAVEETAPEAPAADTPAEPTDSAALQDALNAYNAARQSTQAENLEAELNGYVAAGKLTQEQADLILKYYKDRQALRDGVCPNCGYQFENNGGFGKGGRMNGGKGGRGGMGGKSGFGGGRSMIAPNNGQSGGQANGTAFEGEVQFDLEAEGFEGI